MSAKSTKEGIREVREDDPGPSPAQGYLLIYNLGCAMGWNFVMFNMGSAFIEGGGMKEAVDAAHDAIVVLQLFSMLEIVHSCTGLVKSSPVTTFMQVVGRNVALFSVVTAFPAVRGSLWVFMTFAAWTASEIIRYPYYALSIAGMCPRTLYWLRYTAFIVLYPLGFIGELGVWLVGLPYIRALGLPILPGLPRGSLVYALYGHLLISFGYGAPRLYMHMLRQRRKQIHGIKKPKPKAS